MVTSIRARQRSLCGMPAMKPLKVDLGAYDELLGLRQRMAS